MDRVFTIEQLRPIKNGMTISRDAKMGTTTGITFFSLGKDTSISQECYEQHHQSRIRNCIRRYALCTNRKAGRMYSLLTLILSPACKMSLYKIGIFWIIIATASVRIIAIVLSYAVC